MVSELAKHNGHFISLSPEVEQQLSVLCTDERGMQGEQFGLQLAGAIHGVAQSVHTARVIGGERPMHTDLPTDARVANALNRGVSHKGCAALMNILALDGMLVADPMAVYRQAEGLAPGLLVDRDMQHAVEAAQYRIDNELHRPTEKVLEMMSDMAAQDGEPVRHVGLHHDVAHAGDVMISNDVAGEYHDTARAFAEGMPAYGLTLHRLGDLAMRLDAMWPNMSRGDAFVKGAVIHQGVVSLAVPNSTGEAGVRTLYRGQHFAKIV